MIAEGFFKNLAARNKTSVDYKSQIWDFDFVAANNVSHNNQEMKIINDKNSLHVTYKNSLSRTSPTKGEIKNEFLVSIDLSF